MHAHVHHLKVTMYGDLIDYTKIHREIHIFIEVSVSVLAGINKQTTYHKMLQPNMVLTRVP